MSSRNPLIGGTSHSNIFINYRREDSADTVGRIYSWLNVRTEIPIFYDVEALDGGVNFRTAVENAIHASVCVLVIIGKNWLTAESAEGDRRLDVVHDLVREEIELALQNNKFILPILVQSGLMPKRDDLPSSIVGLADLNAIPVRPGSDFDSDMKKVRRAISNEIGINKFHAPIEISPNYGVIGLIRAFFQVFIREH